MADNVNFDGPKMIDKFLIALSRANGEETTARQIEVFNKYGLSSVEGMGLVLEIANIFKEENNDNS